MSKLCSLCFCLGGFHDPDCPLLHPPPGAFWPEEGVPIPRIAELEAENARLRKALAFIVEKLDSLPTLPALLSPDINVPISLALAEARRALRED